MPVISEGGGGQVVVDFWLGQENITLFLFIFLALFFYEIKLFCTLIELLLGSTVITLVAMAFIRSHGLVTVLYFLILCRCCTAADPQYKCPVHYALVQ